MRGVESPALRRELALMDTLSKRKVPIQSEHIRTEEPIRLPEWAVEGPVGAWDFRLLGL